MGARPRIDLDGVELRNAEDDSQVIGIFRYRTVQGLVILVPESADVLVPWKAISEANLDLNGGHLRIRLSPEELSSSNWLRGATELVGTWVDRMTMDAQDIRGL